jgi:uroporphyrinogen decarboxylase
MEALLVDMCIHPDLAAVLMNKVTEISVALARKVTSLGVDILWLADDFGTQQDLIVGPPMWQEWFKPRLRRVIASAKQINPNVIVAFHSDGNVEKIVPDLIDIGVEVLNPVQPECMDPAKLKADYGEHLAFWGAIGTQTTLPFGTPQEVKAVVKERIETVGAKGGFIIAPTHVVEPEVPWENILAFVEAVEEYGVY